MKLKSNKFTVSGIISNKVFGTQRILFLEQYFE